MKTTSHNFMEESDGSIRRNFVILRHKKHSAGAVACCNK